LEYASTISKLKEEVTSLKTGLSQKTKEEERLKEQVKGLEEEKTKITNYITVRL